MGLADAIASGDSPTLKRRSRKPPVPAAVKEAVAIGEAAAGVAKSIRRGAEAVETAALVGSGASPAQVARAKGITPEVRRAAKQAQQLRKVARAKQKTVKRAIAKDPPKAEKLVQKSTKRIWNQLEVKGKGPAPKIELGQRTKAVTSHRPTVQVSKTDAKKFFSPAPKVRHAARRTVVKEAVVAQNKVPPKPPKPSPEKVQRQFVRGKRLLPGLDAEQTRVAAKVLRTGLKKDATKQELLSAAETGIVESGFRNLDYGDADSEGWRQERTSIYGTGAKGPTNVKAAAKRYFAEAREAGAQPTAGQLAQATQQSAFPERYDQVEAQAKPIVRAYVRAVKGKPAATTSVKQKPGKYAGSQRAVLEVIPKGVRAEGRGDKRTPAENAAVGGSATSDHLTTNTNSYAADIPGTLEDGRTDKVAQQIAKRLGMQSHRGTNTVTKDGYRYQLIWQTGGHYDHIHLGAVWVGAGAAPSVSSTGGSVASGAPGTTTLASNPATRSPSKPDRDLKGRKRSRQRMKAKAKRMEGRQRSRLIRQLISEGPMPAEQVVKTPAYTAPARRKVTVSL